MTLLRGLCCVLFLPVLVLRADVGVGDTYEQVIAEKGAPSGRMEAGAMMILRYADQTIRLKAGKVTSVEAVHRGGAGSVPVPAPEPRPVRREEAAAPADEGPIPALAWTTDYRGALEQAKQQNRKLFLLFTGSDWCPWCKRLDREILQTRQFASYAADNLVLVFVDFPHEKKLPLPIQRQNVMMRRAFSVQGYPTVVILDPNGRHVADLGYEQGGPEPFLDRLKSL